MSEQTLSDLRDAYDAFGSGDLDGVLAVMDPDVEWDATAALAHRGRFYGHDGVRQYIQTLSQAWDSFELNADEFIESGGDEHVMVLGEVAGVEKSSGAQLRARFAHVLRLRDGKVVRLQVLLDRDSAMRALETQAAS